MGAFNKEVAWKESTLLVRGQEVVVRGTKHINGLWNITVEAYLRRDWVTLFDDRMYPDEDETWDDIVESYVTMITDELDSRGYKSRRNKK